MFLLAYRTPIPLVHLSVLYLTELRNCLPFPELYNCFFPVRTITGKTSHPFFLAFNYHCIYIDNFHSKQILNCLANLRFCSCTHYFKHIPVLIFFQYGIFLSNGWISYDLMILTHNDTTSFTFPTSFSSEKIMFSFFKISYALISETFFISRSLMFLPERYMF